MKRLILAACALCVASSAIAQVHVRGYTRRDGTYVAPHYRSSPNSSTLDNYSTRGNVNPYTGQVGTKDPYGSSSTYSNPYSRPYSAPTTLYGSGQDDPQ